MNQNDADAERELISRVKEDTETVEEAVGAKKEHGRNSNQGSEDRTSK